MKINFKLNNNEVSLNIRPDVRLSYVLEHVFHINSMRIACRKGICGSCMVLQNGNPVNSCQIPLYKVREQNILTVEGIAENPLWKILEESFMRENVYLCNFCAPSRGLTLYALLSETGRPERERINMFLEMVQCRCTAHDKLLRGILTAIDMKRDENDLQ